MSTSQPSHSTGDALIDEVRGVRRAVCQEFGNDVDRLCDHLQEIERQYASRSGPFADVSKQAAAKVVEGWGEEARKLDDPIADDLRLFREPPGEGTSTAR